MTSPVKKPAGVLWILDALFLFSSVVVSALPYLTGLGFYEDDWSYNSALAQAPRHNIAAMLRTLFVLDDDLRLRPVQAAYVALRYRAFGRHPLPWHIVDQVVLGLAVVAFYLAMRELLNNRPLAFTVALVFGLLPHYSSDRVWTAMAAGLCALFAYGGIFALTRSVTGRNNHPKSWLILAVAAMALSILSYEVEFGLIAMSVLVAGWWVYRRAGMSASPARGRIAGIASVGAVLLAIFLAKAHLETRITYHRHIFNRLGAIFERALSQAVRFNLWTYVLHMPVVLAGLYHHSAFSRAAIGIAVLVTCATALYLWRSPGLSSLPSPVTCLWLLLTGFVIFALGFGLFSTITAIDFTTMGPDNRVAIASALGAACVLVSIAGLLCNLLKPAVRARSYAVAIALICGTNCLVMSGIGHFWVDAAQRQQAVVQSVQSNVRDLPHGAVLLLDGVCRYSGPAVVFDTEYDTRGVIQLALRDSSLDSNIISSTTYFGAAAIKMMYAEPYPYGKNVFVYNVPNARLLNLTSQEAATAYLRAMNPAGGSGCPPVQEGMGARVY